MTITTLVGYVSQTEALRQNALHNGAAIKASCIEDKLRHLRTTLEAVKNIQSTWSVGSQNPAYAQRTMDRLVTLELSGNSYFEEARACTEARDSKFELEVIVPPNLPDAPPPWSIQTPPTFERPPLASPY
jgi:hypothetical protein